LQTVHGRELDGLVWNNGHWLSCVRRNTVAYYAIFNQTFGAIR
jgi:hypothetical protein